jgi:hypothetical protein
MKQATSFLCAVIVTILVVVGSPARANDVVISADDSGKLLALERKLSDFNGDSIARETAMFRRMQAKGLSLDVHALLCIQEMDIQLYSMLWALNGAAVAAEMSASLMTNIKDESLALQVLENALKTASKTSVSARSGMNDTLGKCSDNPLLYDKAKTLIGIIQEGSTLISPMLRKVQAAQAEHQYNVFNQRSAQ